MLEKTMSTIITITITITIITITITITIITITITIIQHPSSSSIIISSSNIFCLLSTCHTIDSGSLGPTLMFCGQSMPTPQLRRDH